MTTGLTLWEDHNSERLIYPNALCSTIYNSQDMEATSMSIINEWVGKMRYMYTVEHCSAIKKEVKSIEAMWMNLEPVIQSGVSQRKTNIIYYCTYVKSGKEVLMNLFARQE